MERTRFIDHEGRRIVLMDFADIWRVDEAVKVIEEARKFVASQPKVKNLLTLVDVKASSFDDRVVAKLKELARHDEPWVLAGAVVGMSGMQKILYRIINTFSGRKLAAFDTQDEAKAWLVRQDEPPATVPEPK